jgi:hypothetical protein
LDNYELIIYISTKGFTWPVSPDLKWSVRRGWLKTSTVFESVLESSSSLSGCSLWLPGYPGDEVDDTWVDSYRGCLVGSFLDGDIFP